MSAHSNLCGAMGFQNARLQSIAKTIMTLYGYFRNYCIYESSEASQSLHTTKRGALKAMIEDQYKDWGDGRSNKDSNLHLKTKLGKVVFRYGKKDRDFRDQRRYQTFAVRAVETQK